MRIVLRSPNDDAVKALIRFTQDDAILRHLIKQRDLDGRSDAAIREALERLLSRFAADLAFGLGYSLRDKDEDRRFTVGVLALDLVYAAIVCDRTGVRDEAAVTEAVVRSFVEPAGLLLRIEEGAVPALVIEARDLLRRAEPDLVRDIRAMVERDLSLIANGAPSIRRSAACAPLMMALTGLPAPAVAKAPASSGPASPEAAEEGLRPSIDPA